MSPVPHAMVGTSAPHPGSDSLAALWDVWPLVADISEIEFVHNEALVAPHDKFFWNVPQGPELRTGATSVTVTDAYYDGGFSSDGIFTYAVPTEFWIVGTGASEPGATWNATWERAEWADHGAFLAAMMIWAVNPSLPDIQLEINVNLLDVSMEDTVTAPGGVRGDLDGRIFEYIAPTGTFVSKGSRFERCGGNTPQGKGGATIKPPPAGALWLTARFENNEFVANTAGVGPGVYIVYGPADVDFRRCLFLNNEAWLSGGAIFVVGSPGLTLSIAQSV